MIRIVNVNFYKPGSSSIRTTSSPAAATTSPRSTRGASLTEPEFPFRKVNYLIRLNQLMPASAARVSTWVLPGLNVIKLLSP